MDEDTRMSPDAAPEVTIGLDLGDRYSHFHILDAQGTTLEEGRLTTTPRSFGRRFGLLPRARVAVEVGTHSPWVSRLFEELGHEILVADARRLRAIYANEMKCDRIDAEMLARLARVDPQLLSPIRHRGTSFQADLAILRARDVLVRARTQLVNHVRGTTKAWGDRLPACSTPSFHHQVAEHIPKALKPALQPVLTMLGQLTGMIRLYDRILDSQASTHYPETSILRQVPGVGPLTALNYVLTIEDPARFRKSRTVAAYLGLTPRRAQSGEHDPQLRITKCGDRDLRRLLVQSAQYILGPFAPETSLRTWGLAIATRGGKKAKRRAVIAVARKLAVLLHRLWITGETYEPLHSSAKPMTRDQVA